MPTIAQAGDVVLVKFPFTDLTTAKLRPAVVLATHGDDLTIAGIFSGPQPPRETWVPLNSQDPAFSQTGLKTTSVIKAERIAVKAPPRVPDPEVVDPAPQDRNPIITKTFRGVDDNGRTVKLVIEFPAEDIPKR